MCSKLMHIIGSLWHTACICNTCICIFYTVLQFPSTGLPPSSCNFTQQQQQQKDNYEASWNSICICFLPCSQRIQWNMTPTLPERKKTQGPSNKSSTIITAKSCHNVKVACVPSGKIKKKTPKPNNNTTSWILFLWRWQVTHIFIFIDIWREYFTQSFPTGKLLN